jgi:hypothetical protein
VHCRDTSSAGGEARTVDQRRRGARTVRTTSAEPAQSWFEVLLEQFEKTPLIVVAVQLSGQSVHQSRALCLRRTSVTASCAPIFAPLTTGGAFQRAEDPAPLLPQLRADRHSEIQKILLFN